MVGGHPGEDKHIVTWGGAPDGARRAGLHLAATDVTLRLGTSLRA